MERIVLRRYFVPVLFSKEWTIPFITSKTRATATVVTEKQLFIPCYKCYIATAGWLLLLPTCQLAAAGVALVTDGAAHHLLTGRLTYKTRQTSVPEYLSRHITTRSSTRSLRSSSAPLLHVPFRRTSFGKLSFSTAAPSVWNSLPVSVQNCDTLTLFKSRLKAHLFSSVYAS